MPEMESGFATIETGLIEPDDNSGDVHFTPGSFPMVVTGPVLFRRSQSDPSWADKVVQKFAVAELLQFFAAPTGLTRAGTQLILSEAAALVGQADRAPSAQLREAHLEFARGRLADLSDKLATSRKKGIAEVRQLLSR